MSKSLAISEELNEALNKFPRIELKDLLENLPEEGAQMERIDRKYPFHISQVPEVIKGMEAYYEIVRAAGSLTSPYESWYMDTSDFKFFRNHHSGRRKRAKVRYRAYPRTHTTFLEVKRKNDKGLTLKSRIPCDSMNYPFGTDEMEFLKESIPGFNPDILKPAVYIKYDRIAFIHPEGKERFSIDFNITAQIGDKTTNFGDAVVLEVMQDKKATTPITLRMRDLGLREGSISKYCLTMSLLDKNLKSNLFKRSLRRMEKIMNEY